ncbi:MAG: tryptophan 2,3-dioxygenase [Burkholderiales bacterium]|nr:tryptophan 2,3-dioxygenase [Burkholderiales bacterium]
MNLRDESVAVTGAENAHQTFKDSFSYSSYLRIEQLLNAQSPLTDAHDEVLFITIHHVQEVWMSLIIKELSGAMARLSVGDFEPAMKMLARVSRAQEQMGAAWEVLKTMTPADYLAFRSAFGKASGFQSWQYRSVEFLLGNRQRYLLKPFAEQPEPLARLTAIIDSPSLYDIALQALANRGLLPPSALRTHFDRPPEARDDVLAAWLTVYRQTTEYWDLYYLAEKLVDVEDNFRRWRFNHLTTVERLIGNKIGSGGTTGVGYLKRALDIVLFPELWQVRTEL